jgi:integrase
MLSQVNDQLRAAKCGVRLRQHGDRLYARATYPPKPGEQRPSQREIPIPVCINPAGLKKAKGIALTIGGQLTAKTFSWSSWQDELIPRPETVSAWVERFEKDYFERRARTPKSETTWRKDYQQPLGKLPPDAPLTADLLRNVILLTTDPDTRSRQRYCMTFGALARIAGLELDAVALRGDYGPKRLAPRDLPDDKQITEWRNQIPNRQWQYAFGLMSCYGLRNHELFHVDLEKLRNSPVLSILDGKTGDRRVWAIHPEWWERWELWDTSLLPQVTGRDNSALGNRVTTAMKRYGVIKPYNLRHAWAVRSIEFGLDPQLAAQQMGHSMAVHSRIYHHWISDGVHQRAYDAAMARPDRILPP